MGRGYGALSALVGTLRAAGREFAERPARYAAAGLLFFAGAIPILLLPLFRATFLDLLIKETLLLAWAMGLLYDVQRVRQAGLVSIRTYFRGVSLYGLRGALLGAIAAVLWLTALGICLQIFRLLGFRLAGPGSADLLFLLLSLLLYPFLLFAPLFVVDRDWDALRALQSASWVGWFRYREILAWEVVFFFLGLLGALPLFLGWILVFPLVALILWRLYHRYEVDLL